jgi:hypothetical protein
MAGAAIKKIKRASETPSHLVLRTIALTAAAMVTPLRLLMH